MSGHVEGDVIFDSIPVRIFYDDFRIFGHYWHSQIGISPYVICDGGIIYVISSGEMSHNGAVAVMQHGRRGSAELFSLIHIDDRIINRDSGAVVIPSRIRPAITIFSIKSIKIITRHVISKEIGVDEINVSRILVGQVKTLVHYAETLTLFETRNIEPIFSTDSVEVQIYHPSVLLGIMADAFDLDVVSLQLAFLVIAVRITVRIEVLNAVFDAFFK